MKPDLAKLKVAIVHDWLTNMGGAERVVLAFSEMFPEAPIYTSLYRPEAMPLFKNKDVRTSFIQKIPLANRKHQLFPTLRLKAFERFDFSDYDLVLSSSSAESKGIIVKPPTCHICYCHTPTRYYWSGYDEYYRNPGFGKLNPIIRLFMPALVKHMRKLDYQAAQRPAYLIANSHAVQERIKQYYDRDSVVLFPPVELERFSLGDNKRTGYVMVGRQVPYKRFDIAVLACNELRLPLTIIGDGPEHEKLKSLAGPTITFLTNITDQEIGKYYRSALGLIFPQDEDAGIVPLEAMASGTPVIAYGKGGSLDSIIPAQTGIFFEQQTVEALTEALQEYEKMQFDPVAVRQQALQFSKQNFQTKLKQIIISSLRAA